MRTLIASLSFLFLVSCAAISVDHGPVKTEDRNAGTFTSVKASGAIEIDFTSGSASTVQVEAPDDILPKLVTRNENGMLVIYTEGDVDKLKHPVKVHLQSAALEKVDMSGACSFRLNGPLNNTALAIELSGASVFSGTVYNKTLSVNMTGASQAEIGGITNRFDAKGSGASQLEAKTLSAVEVLVEATGAAQMSVSADSTINAKASGASSIDYSGKPVHVNKDESGASAIEQH